MTDKGYLTSRHRRYLKPLNKAHDTKINGGDAIHSADIPDESVIVQCKRRSSRLKGVAASRDRTVKVIKMGCEMSSTSPPIVADIRMKLTGAQWKLRK